jgi:hypothetical protein
MALNTTYYRSTTTARERYIEVKATAFEAQAPFYVSSAELEFARRHPTSFALYRVYDILKNPRFYVLKGNITSKVDLVPTVYQARPSTTASDCDLVSG